MKRVLVLSLALSLGALSAPAASPGPGPSERPSEWAIAVSGTSVDNLYRIEDGLFRGAQPSASGFRELAALGVRNVLDLAGGSGDVRFVSDGSVKLFHVPMSAWGLRDELVVKALRIMTDAENRPLLVHCAHGADRTGALVALYRIVVQGWTKQQAVREMNEGGYHHNGLFRNLDRYVMNANVDALRKELGVVIAPPPPGSQTTLATLPLSAAPAAPIP